MVTMRDVARLAGVSVGTVSAVVNDKGIVRPKMSQAVKEAIAALDYQPNHVARSLKMRRTFTVGIIIPDITNPFFTQLIAGAEDEARLNKYSVILSDSGENAERERHELRLLFSRGVDGIVLAPTSYYAPEERLTRQKLPIVLVDRLPYGPAATAVITDNLDAAYQGARHLIELGHERLAVLAGRLDLSTARDRLEGIRKALQEANLPLRGEYLKYGDYHRGSGFQCGMELLQLSEPPTAIFSCNNQMTLGLMQALSKLHTMCPRDVSVLGFDDFEWTESFSPQLSTIAQPNYEMGKEAMRLLLANMQAAQSQSGMGEDKLVVLKCELRIRESTGPPKEPRQGPGA
jgi:LacI family transcriptional regulator, galactose operon repressor